MIVYLFIHSFIREDGGLEDIDGRSLNPGMYDGRKRIS